MIDQLWKKSRANSSISKDFRQNLEITGSSDIWDDTNITCSRFGSERLQTSAPNLLVIQKKNYEKKLAKKYIYSQKKIMKKKISQLWNMTRECIPDKNVWIQICL